MELAALHNLMKKTCDHFAHELSGLQIGKASTGLVASLKVEAYGDRQAISQIASVTVMDAQTVKIEPRDKSLSSTIEKGIFESGTGLTPQNMGDAILIKIPPLTQERRKDLTKLISKMGEENKVALRNIRQDTLKDIKKQYDEKLMSEDDKKRIEQEVDKHTKEYSSKIDAMISTKSDEIMSI